MATKRRIEITVETEQVTLLRHDANQAAWCAGCHCHVLMLGLAPAAQLTGLSYRRLLEKAETLELHYYEPADGSLLFCLASLSQWLRRAEQPTLLLPPLAKR